MSWPDSTGLLYTFLLHETKSGCCVLPPGTNYYRLFKCDQLIHIEPSIRISPGSVLFGKIKNIFERKPSIYRNFDWQHL